MEIKTNFDDVYILGLANRGGVYERYFDHLFTDYEEVIKYKELLKATGSNWVVLKYGRPMTMGD